MSIDLSSYTFVQTLYRKYHDMYAVKYLVTQNITLNGICYIYSSKFFHVHLVTLHFCTHVHRCAFQDTHSLSLLYVLLMAYKGKYSEIC